MADVIKDVIKESSTSGLLEHLSSDETLEITLKRDTNEIILRNPKDNRIVKLKANVEEEFEKRIDEDFSEIEPLSVEKFTEALKYLDKLGQTFSAEIFPSVTPKKDSAEVLDNEEFIKLQKEYPTLPVEVGLVAYNTLTGGKEQLERVGGLDSFEKKSESVKKYIITDEFRSEFFFRHALKVPFLENIDWEVVFKTHERGIDDIIGTSYALLMLTFHNTNPRVGKLDLHQNVTVAANRVLIEKLLGILTKVRDCLIQSEGMQIIKKESS